MWWWLGCSRWNYRWIFGSSVDIQLMFSTCPMSHLTQPRPPHGKIFYFCLTVGWEDGQTKACHSSRGFWWCASTVGYGHVSVCCVGVLMGVASCLKDMVIFNISVFLVPTKILGNPNQQQRVRRCDDEHNRTHKPHCYTGYELSTADSKSWCFYQLEVHSWSQKKHRNEKCQWVQQVGESDKNRNYNTHGLFVRTGRCVAYCYSLRPRWPRPTSPPK